MAVAGPQPRLVEPVGDVEKAAGHLHPVAGIRDRAQQLAGGLETGDQLVGGPRRHARGQRLTGRAGEHRERPGHRVGPGAPPLAARR